MQGMFDLKQKIITIALILLIGTALIYAADFSVKGAESPGLYIWNVVPQGKIDAITSGNVSLPVTVQATIYFSNGPYLVYFGDKLVDNGTATGYFVSSNFSIPEVIAGDYKITVVDSTYGLNTTNDFAVETQYIVRPVVPESPAQLKEGDNVFLNVLVTAGEPNTSYTANITIMSASPLSTNYSRLVTFTTSDVGTASTQISFPASTFTPSGSTTNYVGTYTVYFNQTSNLGQSTFTIGITDKTEYHRDETVKISAVGYQSGQTATLTIKNQTNSVLLSRTLTASNQGAIETTWDIPQTAALGTYNVTITPQGTDKAIVDTQTFTLLGYPVTFRALNLAGAVVSGIVIQVHDEVNNLYYNDTTYSTGLAIINLEGGTYKVSAYWNDVKVAEQEVTFTGSSTFNLTCTLTNIQIDVKAYQESQLVSIPYVDLDITIKYGSEYSQSFSVNVQTDLSGKYSLNSTLPDAQYTVKASKYDTVFNIGNDTISSLPEQSHYQVTIICPQRTLTLKTVDSNGANVANARIDLIEQSSGIFYSTSTDGSGSAQLQVVLGQYLAKVYTSSNVLLNQTTISVFSDTQSQILCGLYNLKITIKVVDYFGNPLSNAKVDLSRSGEVIATATTQNDGTVSFNNMVGGDFVVMAYLAGNENSYVSRNIHIDSSTEVNISMANFVSLGGVVMGISMLATIIILVIVVILIAVVVVFKKTGIRLQRKK